MTRHAPTPPSHLEGEALALYHQITGGPRASGPQHFPLVRDDGSLSGPFDAFLLNPQLGATLQSVGAAIRYEGALPPRAREIAILTVAAAWDSAFERDAHEAIGRSVGLTEEELAAIRDRRIPNVGDPLELACAKFALAMTNGDVDDDLWEAGSRIIDAPLVFELTTLVGYYSTLALQLRVFRSE
ncbi:MAG: carboxymuconolactone decarboxylase family protein [Dermatophilaceae bacterium]